MPDLGSLNQEMHGLGSLVFLDRQQDLLQSFLRHKKHYFVSLKYFESIWQVVSILNLNFDFEVKSRS